MGKGAFFESLTSHPHTSSDIGDVRWDLDDLEKSLTASKSGSDRGKVSVADVEQRTTFITQSRQRLTQVQNALSAAAPTRVRSNILLF